MVEKSFSEAEFATMQFAHVNTQRNYVATLLTK